MSTPTTTRRAARLSQRLVRMPADHPLVAIWPQFDWQPGCTSDAIDTAWIASGLASGPGVPVSITTIKTGPHRTVYRLENARGVFFIKHFHPVGWFNWLKHFVRPTRAEHERELALWLTSRGIRTIAPLAVGRRRHHGSPCESLLVMPAIAGLPLDESCREVSGRLHGPERAIWRQTLARALGRCLGELHRVGGDHRDLHAGNVLVEMTATDPRLHLIDLQALRRERSLSVGVTLQNLANFHQYFVGESTRSDRHRFWQAYFAARAQGRPARSQRTMLEWLALSLGLGWPLGRGGEPQDELESVPGVLEARLVEQARQGWDRADRAWKRGNRHVRRLKSGRQRLRGEATLPVDWLQSVVEVPEQLFAPDHVVQFCKNSGRCRVALVRLPVNGTERALCVKSVVAGRWLARWLDGWRLSLVRRAWETGHALLRRRIDTPRPLLCVEVPRPGGTRGYLVTEWIENTETAQKGVTESLPRWPGSDQTAWLASRGRQLASMLRRFHACGFDHRDLKLANLLVSRSLGDPRVWLLDLDGVRRWRRLPRQRAVQNLARLEVSCRVQGVTSASLRLRFLQHYLAGSGEDWREWWNWVGEAGRRKVSQNQRRNRPIS
ncbi:MAG: lipopolysaccharide kinase InaA family protein [Planctomycetaceae bacterium]